MPKTIKLKKGFDLNLSGKPTKEVTGTFHSDTYAIKPTDFPHITRPKLLVKEGDNVKAGSPVLYDKLTEDILYLSPVSGEVVEIKRGEKRKLLEIKILADKEIEYEAYTVPGDVASLDRDAVIAFMKKGGVWPQVVQRPFGVVADPADQPKAIFVSAFDTHPNAPDLAYQLDDKAAFFQTGLDVLSKLTTGKVHLNVNGADPGQDIFEKASGVEINKVQGPHPAGNVGVQIHHIDPINKGDIVWTVSPYGVGQIGKLFAEGKYDASKLVAVTGDAVGKPGYVKTYSGAQLSALFGGALPQGNVRYVSGNLLTGENVGKDGYLGFYHNQVSVLPEGDYEEFLGWIAPSAKKLSFHRTLGLLSFMNRGKEYTVDTNAHGEERSFVISGAFEKVLPMDILPTYLFKAILSEDYDNMEALGILEVVEEDVALCEYIDPSKHDIQAIVRQGINMIKNS